MITKEWIESQLQVEIKHLLKCEGAIEALNAQLKMIEGIERGAEAAGQPETDQLAAEVPQPADPIARTVDQVIADTIANHDLSKLNGEQDPD